MQAAKYTGDTNSIFGITDHQVFFAKLSFFFIECNKLSSFRQVFYNDLFSTDLIRIKSMKRLTRFMLNEIGNINDIVNRPYTNRFQFFLQPKWRFLYGNPFYTYPAIPLTGFFILDSHGNWQ